MRPVVTTLLLLLPLLGAPVTSAPAAVVREHRHVDPSPSGLLVVTPDRVERDVRPGERLTITAKLYNDGAAPLDVSLLTGDLGPAADPRSVATRVPDGTFGAGSWLTPELRDLRLAPFEAVSFDVLVQVPDTAPVGANFGALTVRAGAAGGAPGTADSSGGIQTDAIVQFLITVAGTVRHDLTITQVNVHDTLSLRRRHAAVVDVTVRNDGTVNEYLSGAVAMRSVLGTTPFRGRIDRVLVLRGASRTVRIVWRDVPWVGSFTPTVTIARSGSSDLERRGDRIVILPWWLLVVLGALALLPVAVAVRGRSRRARAHRAALLAARGTDEDWAAFHDGGLR